MSVELKDGLSALLAGDAFTAHEIQALFRGVLDGDVQPVVLGGFLVALSQRGETAEEVAGVALALRDTMRTFEHDVPGAIDTCGTGGDGLGMFNVSTAAALVAAAAGAKVIKHGNRSVSSRSGSADLLEAIGGQIELPEDVARGALEETGFTFLFAPQFHPAMRHAGAVRKALGVRTIFNLVGPLANPGGVQRQVLGVPRPELVDVIAGALGVLGTHTAYVVHGGGGADELTLDGPGVVRAVGEARPMNFDGASLGLTGASVAALVGGDAHDNARLLERVLSGEMGPLRDVVAVNASAALVTAGVAAEAGDGLAQALEAIDSGKARSVVERWVSITSRVAGPRRSKGGAA